MIIGIDPGQRGGVAETWKPVVGFEDTYSVSSLGRIRRDVDGSRTYAGKILKPMTNTNGYSYVFLCRKPRRINARIHAIVAAAFIGERPDGLQINHKNGVKSDNRLCNIEYATPRENIVHSYNELGRQSPKGENHGMSKLSSSDVLAIRGRVRCGESQRTIALDFGVNQQQISRISTGKRWGWLK